MKFQTMYHTPSALLALLVWMAVVGLFTLTRTTDASPVLLDKLFGFAAYQPAYSGGGYGGNQYYGYYGGGGGGGGGGGSGHTGSGFGGTRATSASSQKRQAKGRDYKDICRVVNPAPYAMPGRAPYPAAPFCPY